MVAEGKRLEKVVDFDTKLVNIQGNITVIFMVFLFKKILFIFRERGKERKKGRETSMVTSRIGDLTQNPGMCPDWELNQRPFSLQASTQSTEPHQPGLWFSFLSDKSFTSLLDKYNFHAYQQLVLKGNNFAL